MLRLSDWQRPLRLSNLLGAITCFAVVLGVVRFDTHYVASTTGSGAAPMLVFWGSAILCFAFFFGGIGALVGHFRQGAAIGLASLAMYVICSAILYLVSYFSAARW